MQYRYDPILMLNVPVNNKHKAIDKSVEFPNKPNVLDKAIKAMDAYTIEEEDGVEIKLEGGTYVLYVDGEAQADGSLSRMKQLMKEELRYR